MPNYGVPPLALAARRGLPGLGRRRQASTSTSSAASRSTRSATPTRPSSRRSASQVATLGHISNLFLARAARSRSPSGCSSLLGRARPRLLRQLRRRGQRGRVQAGRAGTPDAARHVIVAAEGGFHGRTMGALALTGKAVDPRAVRPARRRRPVRAVRRRRRAARGRRPTTCAARLPRAHPGRGRRGPAARRLPARPPGRSATRPARCSSLDEIQTGIGRTGALVRAPGTRASRPTSSPWPRASAAACRSARASASARAAHAVRQGDHGTTFGGNPVACAAALAVLDTIERDGLLDHVTRGRRRSCADGHRGARPPAARRRPRARPVAGRRADRAASPPQVRGRRPRRRLPGQRGRSRTHPARAAAGPHRRGRSTRSSPRFPRDPRRRGGRG